MGRTQVATLMRNYNNAPPKRSRVNWLLQTSVLGCRAGPWAIADCKPAFVCRNNNFLNRKSF